uniref:Putative cnidarian restricted protein n=1 Tax=Clytia hemisphaerica TaxID=252671 RepID=A0A069DN14_9CNID
MFRWEGFLVFEVGIGNARILEGLCRRDYVVLQLVFFVLLLCYICFFVAFCFAVLTCLSSYTLFVEYFCSFSFIVKL